MMPYACPSGTPDAASNAVATSDGSAAVVDTAIRTVPYAAGRPTLAMRANCIGDP